MNDQILRAVLAHLTAQTELLAVIARYYASFAEKQLVRDIPTRTLEELREVAPEAAAMAERMGRVEERPGTW